MSVTSRDEPGVTTDDGAKERCASFYGDPIVSLVLGDRFHPGGSELTDRVADLLGLTRGQRVLDAASGTGATAIQLAREWGVSVVGVDLSEALVGLARRRAEEAGVGGTVRFERGDVERLDPGQGPFDAVICECALCTFPSASAALSGFGRILAPGGRLALADVTVDPTRLPDALIGPVGRIVCLAGARPMAAYADLLEDAGFRLEHVERHDGAVLELVDHIADRIPLIRSVIGSVVDVGVVERYVALAREAVESGVIGYALYVAVARGRSVDLDAGDDRAVG